MRHAAILSTAPRERCVITLAATGPDCVVSSSPERDPLRRTAVTCCVAGQFALARVIVPDARHQMASGGVRTARTPWLSAWPSSVARGRAKPAALLAGA